MSRVACEAVVIFLAAIFSLGEAQVVLTTHSDNGCTSAVGETATWTSTPTDFTACNPGTHSDYDGNITSIKVECQSTTMTIRYCYDSSCTDCPGAGWPFDLSNAQSLFSGGCAFSAHHTEYAKLDTVIPASSRPTCAQTSAVVGGDPIANFNDNAAQFWLPPGKLTPILRTPEMLLMAEPLLAGADAKKGAQWMRRIVVMTPQGETVVDVSIKDGVYGGLMDINGTQKFVPVETANSFEPIFPDIAEIGSDWQGPFETLQVTLSWWSSHPVPLMPPPDAYFYHWRNLTVTMGRMTSQMLGSVHLDADVEGVCVAGARNQMYILSAPATEYLGQLGKKYTHLEILIDGVHHTAALEGLLPELWGIRALSSETKALMKKPLEQLSV